MVSKNRIVLFSSLLMVFSTAAARSESPEPTWSFDGTYRMRYESLDNSYRAGADYGNKQMRLSQLLASFKWQQQSFSGQVEVEDARAWTDESSGPLLTSDVNTVEPLQAWIGWRQDNSSALKLGRMTLGIGSGRLLARQRFRNTITAFEGVHGQYKQSDWELQAFYVLPVEIRPSDRSRLEEGRSKIDKNGEENFWGTHLRQTGDSNLDLYYFGFDEEKEDLQLSTVGIRKFKAASTNHWDYDVELAYQTGEKLNRDVRAAMGHVEFGYQVDDRFSSRLAFMLDYASGDRSPNDDEFNSFNDLFGVTRVDLGPTGIYGAFARANLVSPGVKLEISPSEKQTTYISYRAVWLDSENDLQSRSGLRDTDGASGRFVGSQLEFFWKSAFGPRWKLELGGTYLAKGKFFKEAPDAPKTGDTTYFYSQLVYQF